jgi:hypothetical protein
MKIYIAKFLTTATLMAVLHYNAMAQNPIVRNQFSADPSARVFGDKVYVFPSHDILATEGKGRPGWFCMEDYHVFSSSNLTDWTDHGLIITQNKVPWVRPYSYSMWAPDCIERNGKYYFYFPAAPKDTITYGKGFRIGVAVANKPEGPYIPESTSIKGVHGIDPNVFIDKDGQAYLYWSAGHIYGAKLKSNMLELDSKVDTLGYLPTKGLKEGPFLFERNGIYYLTYPHVENKIERLEYAIGDNPLGPFKYAGVIMDESASGCWTNHHSFINFKNQWYLFYHDRDYSPEFDKARSIRADSLSFNADGTIKKVIPTLRGIGVTDAKKEIQVDRYSAISNEGASIDFIDTTNRFLGWKTIFTKQGAWVQYNTVNFGAKPLKKITANMMGEKDAEIEFRTGSKAGPVIATLKTGNGKEWDISKGNLVKKITGVQHIFITAKNNKRIEVDWVSFE